MIDIKNIRYRCAILQPNGIGVDVTELVQSMVWEENEGELAQRATIAFIRRDKAGDELTRLAVPGGYVIIYSNWGEGDREVFRGVIWGCTSRDMQKNELAITAYDNLIYLQRSKDYRWYGAGTSCKDMLLGIFRDWGIPVAKYDGPTVALGKKVFKGQTLADMVLEVLDDAKKRGAGQYIVRSSQGKVEIIPRGSNKTIYIFSEGENVMAAGYDVDLGDLVTRVKIIGQEDKNERAPVEAVVDGKTEFGILQEVIQRSQDNSLAAAKQAAQEILNEKGTPRQTRQISAPDLPFLRKGDKVYIQTRIFSGYYYVLSIQHDATRKEMSVEVGL